MSSPICRVCGEEASVACVDGWYCWSCAEVFLGEEKPAERTLEEARRLLKELVDIVEKAVPEAVLEERAEREATEIGGEFAEDVRQMIDELRREREMWQRRN